MIRDLVSQARSGAVSLSSPSTSSALQLEAVTAERDFFREKYAIQIEEMEGLKAQLKDSQRTIDKLRNQILDLEVERTRLASQVSEKGHGKSPKRLESSSSSSSVTSATCEDDSTKSFPASVDNDGTSLGANSVEHADVGTPENGEETASLERQNVEECGEATSPNADDQPEVESENNFPPEYHELLKVDTDEKTSGNESEEDDKDESDGEGADQIRANAERMLIWANYQTARRATPSKDGTSSYAENEYVPGGEPLSSPAHSMSNLGSSDQIINSIPTSLNKSKNVVDDASSLGSSSRNNNQESVGSWRSGANTVKSSGGRIGNLLNNLRDIIDPPDESEDESDIESGSCSDRD